MLSVSIVTVSQFSRVNFLKILAKCIKRQDYTNIIEWVIVDTSHNGYQSSVQDLSETIESFQTDSKLPKIVYFKSAKENIGGWRNESSMLVSGDIVVCMDDDDYYPPQRVSHAVEKLQGKSALIAGCDKMLFYDIHFGKLYLFKGFGNNHSTNNCMAYWREFLDNHSYDETVTHAEETQFTKNFTEKMIQLDADKTVLQFSHSVNTYNKKRIILNNHFLPPQDQYILEIEKNIQEIINNDEIFNDYQTIFAELKRPQKSVYDIVYYTGFSMMQWSPKQKDLGGSEQAVFHLATEWAKMGKRVAVYGHLSWEGTHLGVEYFDYPKFRFWDKYQTLIFWRFAGVVPYLSFDIIADKIFVDIHDNIPDLYKYIYKFKNKVTYWMVKSEFHRDQINAALGDTLYNIIVVPNGVRVDDFQIKISEPRNKFRMCYCSCYTRGLYRILNNIWPFIYRLEPRAELHVYYGMDLVSDPTFKNDMRLLLSQPGVMDHGRQPVEIINREKHMSNFHFYYTDSLGEIDCISIRESLVAGCIPILSDINLFKYRDGIHVTWLPNIEDYNRQIATGLVEVMHNDKLQAELRTALSKSATIINWRECALQWIELIIK